MFSARPCARPGASACMTLATPAICAAAAAAAPALWPATSTCTSPAAQARAAVTGLSVAPLIDALSCSAITSTDIQITFASFLSFSTRAATSATLTPAPRLAGSLTFRVIGRDGIERLLLGLHDVGQGNVARLVQAQVGGDDRRQRQRQGFQAAVDFA